MADLEPSAARSPSPSAASTHSSSSSSSSSSSHSSSSASSRSPSPSPRRTSTKRSPSRSGADEEKRRTKRSRSRSASPPPKRRTSRSPPRRGGETRRSPSPSSSRTAPPPPPPPQPPRRDFGLDLDRDEERRRERERQQEQRARSSPPKQPAMTQAELQELMQKYKSGGVYIPPAKLALLRSQITDKNSNEYQRMTWDALKKSLNGLINKVNVANIKNIIPELFHENLIRGRGLFCRSIMKAQSSSPVFTQVYAALAAVVNSKFPDIGEMLLHRVIMQFRKAFRRNDKIVCLAAVKFLAHLVNQQVAHEILALQILSLLLEKPTDDSVEMAVEFTKEVGRVLSDLSPQGLHAIFERFRGILHEGVIDKRVQYMIEALFAVRKKEFADFPGVPPALDLVETDDQITHEPYLDEELETGDSNDYFRFDADYEENEAKYAEIRTEILGDDEDEADDEGERGAQYESEDEEDEEEKKQKQVILDRTEADLVNFRRQAYLTIMSSADFEECAHKLLKFQIKEGQEKEMAIMIIECCSQERTFLRFYGLLGQRFCNVNQVYQEMFDELFAKQYESVHRLESNKLRNVAKFFSHLLYTDALPWTVLEYIVLSEEATTSSSRIFIKYLFQDLAEHMGLAKLNTRLKDPTMQLFFRGLFPTSNPRDTRFAINFFTAIGLGALTDGLREHLKNAPKQIMAAAEDESDDESSSSESSSSDSDSSASSSSSSSSSSDESTPPRKRRRTK